MTGATGKTTRLTIRDQIRVVATMYVGYAMFMVLRMAPGAVSTAITTDESLGVSTGDWGRVLAMGTVGAVIGKFIGGYCADRFGGRITFAAGLLVCGLGVSAFAMSTTLWMFQASYFVALMAKSAGWPSMTRIIVTSFRPSEYGRVWGVLSTSSRVGTLGATLLLGGLLAVLEWNWMLMGSGILGLIVAIAFYAALWSPKAAEFGEETEDAPRDNENETPRESHPLDGRSLSAALAYFFTSGRFWLITISLMCMTVMWDFLLMVPLYLNQTLNMTPAAASMASSAFPFGSLISVLCGGFVFDKLDRRSMGWVMGFLLLVATACIGGFLMMPSLGLAAANAQRLAMVLLFIFGLCVSPCYYIPMSVFSIEFGGPRSGFLVALLDAIAFAGNAVFQYFGGAIAEESWSNFLWMLIAVSAISAVSMFVFLRGTGEMRLSSDSPR